MADYWQGQAEKSRPRPRVADWRGGAAICVGDDDKIAARYGARDDANSPIASTRADARAKRKRGKAAFTCFKSYKEAAGRGKLTHDYVMDHLRDPRAASARVVDRRSWRWREEIGDSGELVYAGGWSGSSPAAQTRRARWQLMGGGDLRWVNAAIGKSAPRG